jgi:hypothetical protein
VCVRNPHEAQLATGGGRRALAALAENHYLATDQLAAQLGLGEQVRASLRQSYERWDGKEPTAFAATRSR